MFSISIAVAGAVVFGVSDFFGGLAARRAAAARVVAISQGIGLVPLVVLVAALSAPTDAGSLAWGVGAGLLNAVGLVLFYRGLATGTMSVVAPITALTSALIPLGVGVLLGEQIGAVTAFGVVAALLAVLLVSAEGRGQDLVRALVGRATLTALAAGASFGLFFVFMSRADTASGLTPLLAARATSVAFLLSSSREARARLITTDPWLLLVLTGLTGVGGNALFLLAARTGPLSISGVVVSLYPAATVLLAMLVLRERARPARILGFVLAVVALLLIGIGEVGGA